MSDVSASPLHSGSCHHLQIVLKKAEMAKHRKRELVTTFLKRGRMRFTLLSSCRTAFVREKPPSVAIDWHPESLVIHPELVKGWDKIETKFWFLNPCSWLLCSSVYQKLVSYIRLSEACGKQQQEELKCHAYSYISTPVSWCFPISLSHHPYCLNLSSRELRDMLAQGYGFALCCRLVSCLENIQMLLILCPVLFWDVPQKWKRERRGLVCMYVL